ncbi:hypothetical protein BGW36DRAFT_361004 [Talaromyces proteolyticus]|uniref:Uncharacterized protein n=1 Tax=Talaromyces proteolyticus TaxID=1131652 RepID=A0AAD4KRC1_9EURO|nr:uncharacterized protein BGW36DRAFT_361004 [Talaromyces proteolyticus]KAH8695301.1 hypothetical protein BGW36DRAFT_361004 [Talaromyces proteolyticus]
MDDTIRTKPAPMSSNHNSNSAMQPTMTMNSNKSPNNGSLSSIPESNAEGCDGIDSEESEKVKIGYTVRSKLVKKHGLSPQQPDDTVNEKKPKSNNDGFIRTSSYLQEMSMPDVPLSGYQVMVNAEKDERDKILAEIKQLESSAQSAMILPPLGNNGIPRITQQAPLASVSYPYQYRLPKVRESTITEDIERRRIPMGFHGEGEVGGYNYKTGSAVSADQLTYAMECFSIRSAIPEGLDKRIENLTKLQEKSMQYAHFVTMSNYRVKQLKIMENSYRLLGERKIIFSGMHERWQFERRQLEEELIGSTTARKWLLEEIIRLSKDC